MLRMSCQVLKSNDTIWGVGNRRLYIKFEIFPAKGRKLEKIFNIYNIYNIQNNNNTGKNQWNGLFSENVRKVKGIILLWF